MDLATRLFAPFEGRRSATPLALYRIVFFVGLLLHFGPSLLWLDENYAAGVIRSDEWSHWLYMNLWRIPPVLVRIGSLVTLAAIVLAMVGWWTRAAVIVGGVGMYVFASFNGLPVQTLALVDTWALLLLWMICGGGDAALSLRALREKKSEPATEPKLLGALIAYQALLIVFFSGIEKLLAGWPATNELHRLFSYPAGFVTRDWPLGVGLLHDRGFTRVLCTMTLFIELGSPILLLFRRTRLWALLAWELFFLGVVATIEVPPLFYCMFAPAPLLLLDDEQFDRLAKRLRLLPRR
jgi:hypothetical protein